MSEHDLRAMRVLELGEGVSSAFSARLLADHGANVVKVETRGDPWMRLRGPYPGGARHGPPLGIQHNAHTRTLCREAA